MYVNNLNLYLLYHILLILYLILYFHLILFFLFSNDFPRKDFLNFIPPKHNNYLNLFFIIINKFIILKFLF